MRRYIQYGVLPAFDYSKRKNGGILIVWDRQKREFVMAHHRIGSVHQTGFEAVASFSSAIALILTALAPQYATHNIQWGLHWYWFVVAAIVSGYVYVSHDGDPKQMTPIVPDNRVIDSYKEQFRHLFKILGATILISIGVLLSNNFWLMVLVMYVCFGLCVLLLIFSVTSALVHYDVMSSKNRN